MSSDNADRAQGRTIREIEQAVNELHMTMAEFDRAVLEVVEQKNVENPLNEREVRDALVDWHSMCMLVFTRLRPYIQLHLEDDYWETDEYDLLSVGGDEAGGLHVLDDLHSPYDAQVREERVRSKGTKQRAYSRADLLDPAIYRKVTELLTEAKVKLGFGPAPHKHTERVEITEEHMEKVKKWRDEHGLNEEIET